MNKQKRESLRDEIRAAINRHSAENGSNTPDLILAEYLTGCLAAFDRAVNMRETWYGRGMETPVPYLDKVAMGSAGDPVKGKT